MLWYKYAVVGPVQLLAGPAHVVSALNHWNKNENTAASDRELVGDRLTYWYSLKIKVIVFRASHAQKAVGGFSREIEIDRMSTEN